MLLPTRQDGVENRDEVYWTYWSLQKSLLQCISFDRFSYVYFSIQNRAVF